MPESIVKLETQFQGDFLEIRDIITRNRKHYPNSIFPSNTMDRFQDCVPNRQQHIQIRTKIYVSQKYAQLRLRKPGMGAPPRPHCGEGVVPRPAPQK